MRQRETADCVIVGGGPAGSGAAEAIAKLAPRKQVILLEKRARPHGTCAGGVGFNWLDEMGMRLPANVIETPIKEVQVHGPSQDATIHADDLGKPELGAVLDRWGFDEWLLCRAIAEGAEVRRNHHFDDIVRENGKWLVKAHNADGPYEILTDYVIDASGPSAFVAKRLGMKLDEEPSDVHVGLQWTVPLPDPIPIERLELWFKRDPEFQGDWACKTGYVWSFASRHPYWDGGNPVKAGRYTRLGTGVDMEHNRIAGRSAKEVLEQFQRHFPDFAGPTVSENGGLIPTGQPLQTAWENVFVVGDAGRHVSALHGGGIWFGRVAGEEAGKTVAKGGAAEQYERGWQSRIGWTLRVHYALKKVLYSLENKEIDIMVAEMAKFKVGSADAQVEIPRLAMHVAKHPLLGSKFAVKTFLEMAKGAVA
jgi:flavin-dependent dehydrogenase